MLDQSSNQLTRLNDKDNVALALQDIPLGTQLKGLGLTAMSSIPRGHKLAVRDIKAGETIQKYAQVIGVASVAIKAGDHVHSHNCSVDYFERDYDFCAAADNSHISDSEKETTFRGYRRADGKVGTRNYLGILTSVNCSATVARLIADRVNNSGILERYPNVDGVVPLIHGTGCCIKSNGEGYANLQRTLNGYASRSCKEGRSHRKHGERFCLSVSKRETFIRRARRQFEAAPQGLQAKRKSDSDRIYKIYRILCY